MKKVLGLDLGTASIGWALIEIDEENKTVRIIGLGSRILPMDAGEIGKFESGATIVSTASQRTTHRSARKVNQRYILRKDRLHLVLNLLKALPEHYAIEIDFERKGKKCGQFKENREPKIAYKINEQNSKHEFYFEDAFNEMIEDLQKVNPNIHNKKGQRVPKDWTLYYLRQKALSQKITLEELAWVLLSYNQKRGYEKLEVEDENSIFIEKLKEFGFSERITKDIGIAKKDVIIENLNLKVVRIEDITTPLRGNRIYLENGFNYDEYTTKQLTHFDEIQDEFKEVEILHFVDDKMNIIKDKSLFKISDIYTLKIDKVDYQKNEKKHHYNLIFNNGWSQKNEKNNPTKQFDSLIGKEVTLIVKTIFNTKGAIINKISYAKELLQYKTDFNDKNIRKIESLNIKTDWKLLKKKTEKEAIQFNIKKGYIDKKTKTVKNYISPKIYDILKQDATTGNRTKIIGGMFQVVERQFYREELNQIIKTQKEWHKDSPLNEQKIFEDCVKLLYPHNEKHAKTLQNIQQLLVEDILLYQRDLKSKKSEISDCKYEIRNYYEEIDKSTGEIILIPNYRKAVAVSHPLFQEFRIWDKIHNLKLIAIDKIIDGKKETNVDITKDFLKTETDYQHLFELFNNQKTVNQKQFLKFCSDNFGVPNKGIVWNYPEDEELKGNETRVSFAFRFKRCGFTNYADFLTQEKEIALWHYLYSVNYKERKNKDNQSIKNFFSTLFSDFKIEPSILEKIVTDFAEYPKFESRYGAYSEKALKKLLPFIRLSGDKFNGQFEISETFKQHLKAIEYDANNIFSYLKLDKESTNNRTKQKNIEVEKLKQQLHENLWKDSINKRITDIINKTSQINFSAQNIDYLGFIKTEVNEQKGELAFPKGLFNAFKDCNNTSDFTGLNLTQASYLVYGRHSELAKAKFWKNPTQVREGIIKELKQHSLNNPVAEKVLREMMQVVADIWENFGEGKEDYFNKIHVEVGRELKKSAAEKDAASKRQTENKNQNIRLRNILKEFLSESPYNAIPNSLDHFERLKLAEDSALHQKDFNKNYFGYC